MDPIEKEFRIRLYVENPPTKPGKITYLDKMQSSVKSFKMRINRKNWLLHLNCYENLQEEIYTKLCHGYWSDDVESDCNYVDGQLLTKIYFKNSPNTLVTIYSANRLFITRPLGDWIKLELNSALYGTREIGRCIINEQEVVVWLGELISSEPLSTNSYGRPYFLIPEPTKITPIENDEILWIPGYEERAEKIRERLLMCSDPIQKKKIDQELKDWALESNFYSIYKLAEIQ